MARQSGPNQPRSVRTAMLIAMAVGLLLLTAAQYFVAGNFVERQLRVLEVKDAFKRLDDLHHALGVLQADLSTLTGDWAQWDQLYRYTTGDYPPFTEYNLEPQSIARLRLDLFVILDIHGAPLFAKVLDVGGQSLSDIPPDLVAMLGQHGELVHAENPRTLDAGILGTSAGAFLVSSQPILDYEGKQQSGRLIMGRSMQGFVVPALSSMTGERWELVAAGEDSAGQPYRVNGRDQLLIAGDALVGRTSLEDLWKHTAVTVQVRMERPIESMLRNARRYLLLTGAAIGLLSCIVVLVIVRRNVIKPLEDLTGALVSVGADGTVHTRVPESAATLEFSMLSRSINAMLQQLEEQQKMQRDRDAALEANRLKSEFLATMSHEIRTPMNGVLGMCELLQRTELNPRQRHLSDTILRSARSLLDILNDTLDFSKIEAGKLQLESAVFGPQDLMHNVTAPFVAAAQAKGLDFFVRVESDVPELVVGDALRLRQILNNLISNAVKFTDEGSVSALCTLAAVDAEHVELCFTVTDTGIGISQDAQRRVFEPFAQAERNTSRRFGGTGLGLAIVRRLVDVMRGRLGVQSEPGRGSTFWFTAVLQPAPEVVLPKAVIVDATGPRFSLAHAPSVLLAEDNPVNREVLTEMLEHIGCRVSAVEDGAQAVSAAMAQRFQAIVMDCQMPVKDGPTAAAEIRAMEQGSGKPRTVIIALTADATAENRQRCLDAGMDWVVTKPVSQGSLRDLILRAVRPRTAEPCDA